MHAKEGKAEGARTFVFDTAVVAAAQLLLKLRGLVTIPLIVKVLGTAEDGGWGPTLAPGAGPRTRRPPLARPRRPGGRRGPGLLRVRRGRQPLRSRPRHTRLGGARGA